MADTSQDIQLSRFVRPIGVTGLGTVQTSRTARRLRTLSDSFDGVLGTGVSAEPGTRPADLSYLTLAPLVAQGLAQDERDAGAVLTSSAESIPSNADDDSGSATPEDDELRVRDLLRDDRDASASERDLRPPDMTVSDEQPWTTSDLAADQGRSERGARQGDRSDAQSSITGQDDQSGHRGGDGPAELSDWNPGRTPSDTPRNVVEQSMHDGDISGSERPLSGPDDRQVPSPPDGPGSGQGSDSPAARGLSDAVPTTVVRRGTPGSDESGAENGGQTGPPTEADADLRTPGDGRGGPALTVTAPGTTEVSAKTDAESVSEPSGSQRQSRPTGSPDEKSSDDAVTERSIIRSDGRLNQRIFDRLYEEVSRKMRLERDREGR